MRVLRIILVTLAILIAIPIIIVQAVGIYVNIGTAKFDEAEKRAKQAELERVANPLTRECVRMKQDRPSPWDVDEKKYADYLNRYIEACRQAVANDPADNRAKITLSSALFDAHRRDEAIVPLREAAASGDSDALVEIFEWHKSW